MSATRAQIERLTEANICSAISAALTAAGVTLPVDGFLQPAATGTAKLLPRSCVDVRMLPRVSAGYESDILTLSAVVVVQVATEADPDRSVFVGALEAVMGALGEWESDDDALAASLGITDVFRADAAMFEAGGDAGYDDAVGVCYAIITLSVRGCALHADQ